MQNNAFTVARVLCRCLLLLSLMGLTIEISAQVPLFHPSGLTKANLTTGDATKYEYYQYSPGTDGLWLMSLTNFSSQVSGGYLRIKIPGNDTLRIYKARYVETYPNGNIIWYGDLQDTYSQELGGYASLTCYGGKVIGNF